MLSPGAEGVRTAETKSAFYLVLRVSGPGVSTSRAIFDLIATATRMVWYDFSFLFEMGQLRLQNIKTLAPAEVGCLPHLSAS